MSTSWRPTPPVPWGGSTASTRSSRSQRARDGGPGRPTPARPGPPVLPGGARWLERWCAWCLGIALVGVSLATFPFDQAGLAQTVAFTEQYLRDPKNIAVGRNIWAQRCQFCHGKTAYPGKAPKLDPSRYTADFVYDRVTNGFRGMPGWKQEFSEAELRAVVAYVLSREFSN